MKLPLPCPECDDEITCPHSSEQRELLWRRAEDGSIGLALSELVTLMRMARGDVAGQAEISGHAETLLERIDAALERWKHLPDFAFD